VPAGLLRDVEETAPKYSTENCRLSTKTVSMHRHHVHVQLAITFALVRCACGTERQAGQRCPECGREAEEADEDLERRRAIVRAVSHRTPPGDVEPLVLENAFSSLGAWLDGFFAAYEATGDGSADDVAPALRASLGDLDALHRRASRADRLRPNHAVWAAIDDVLAAYDGLRDTYLEALTAATVEDAERAAPRGQAAIDVAAAALDRFNAVSDAWDRVEAADLGDEHGDLLAGAEAIAALIGTADMVELDRKGAEFFVRITGGDVPCPTGFGLRLQLLDLAVEASMDSERFWRAARTVYKLLAEHGVALRGLFDDPDWRADLTALTVETRDAGFEAAAVGAAAGVNRRRLVQSALRLAARQIERAAQPLVATLVAVCGRQSYARERRRDVNALLTRAGQMGLDDLLLGFDPKLRDADAHGEFELDGEGVRLTGTRGKLNYLTDEQLLDVTLAGTESIVALYSGLVGALVAAGVDPEALEEAVAAEIADADKIKLVLLLNGWHDVDVRIDDGHVLARGERDAANAWGVLAAVVAVVPETCETVTLVATDETGTHTASGPLAPFRRWSGADNECEKEIAFTLASLAWTVDGEPILTRAHSEKVYAYRAVEALYLSVPVAEAIKVLRSLREAARAIASEDLAAALTAALRLRREVATGVAPSKSVDAVIHAFDRWLLVDLPETRSSW
jgi:hypothetical protein